MVTVTNQEGADTVLDSFMVTGGIPQTGGGLFCGRVDMGAYKFGIGDYDCDQAVDLADFVRFQQTIVP